MRDATSPVLASIIESHLVSDDEMSNAISARFDAEMLDSGCMMRLISELVEVYK